MCDDTGTVPDPKCIEYDWTVVLIVTRKINGQQTLWNLSKKG